jgi:hypothetical protein
LTLWYVFVYEKGREFSWNNRKNIGINFRDVLKMEKIAEGNPVLLKK